MYNSERLDWFSGLGGGSALRTNYTNGQKCTYSGLFEMADPGLFFKGFQQMLKKKYI